MLTFIKGIVRLLCKAAETSIGSPSMKGQPKHRGGTGKRSTE